MNVYLSGPMTGLPEWNYPAFNRAAQRLRDYGYEVFNPAEFCDDPESFNPREAFYYFCNYITKEADCLFLLPGWKNSQGANLEVDLAKICGIPCYNYDDFDVVKEILHV